MHLTSNPVLEVTASREVVAQRIRAWANEQQFKTVADSGGRFVFKRGSGWSALWTFDLKKIPTHVEVNVTGAGPLTVAARWEVKSGAQVSTKNDQRRLEDQVQIFIAKVKGAV